MGLQVIVHTDDHISRAFIEPGHDRVVLTGVRSQLHDPYTVVVFSKAVQLAKSFPAVRRSVVHQNELEWGLAQLLEFFDGQLHDLADRVRRFVAGDDDRIQHGISSHTRNNYYIL